MINRRLPSNVYRREITLLYGTTAEINAVLRKQLGADGHALCLETCSEGKWICYARGGFEADYICVVRNRSRAAEFSALAHEVLHHVGHTMRTAGVPFTAETEEAYCYYHHWVTDQCLQLMARVR